MKDFFEIKIGRTRYKIDSSITFLIVEDQVDIQYMLGKDLRRTGFKGDIYACDTLESAKESLQLYKIDLVFLDLNLKYSDSGFDVLKYLKSNYRDIPVIILTAECAVDKVILAIEKGASEYIIKPWYKTVLIKKLAHVLAS
jgi:DNA-binding response OmpR family regulator